MTAPRITTFLCLIVLSGILAAGLSPFHVPRNAVSWLPDINGLRFDRYGSVISNGAVPDDPGQDCTLEVWVESAVTRSSRSWLLYARDSAAFRAAPTRRRLSPGGQYA